MHPDLVPGFDVALLVFNAFVLFFIGLIFYLRREDRREGYPLEDDLTGRLDTMGGTLHTASIKRFLLPFDRGVAVAGGREREPVSIAARREGFPGAPLIPTGNPLADGIGPAAWANRANVPDLDMEGTPRIVPIGMAAGFGINRRDTDPRGLPVVAADGAVAGTVSDLWVDKADRLVRYLQVTTSGGEVLAPMMMSKIKRDRVVCDALSAHQFAGAPAVPAGGTITFYEEERAQAYFGGGYLYANAQRAEPLL